jgi:hypothetical protein
MCNYTNTHFEVCGCTLSTQTEMCGYQDDDFSECMRWTIIKELEPRNESCGRSACKYKAPAVPPPEKKEIEWTV